MHCFTITAKASQDLSGGAPALVPVADAAEVAVVVAATAVEVVADAVGIAV